MTEQAMTPAEMVAAYIKLRDHISEAKKEFEVSLQRPKAAMDKLESKLLAHLQATGGESIRTKAGTVYRNTQYSTSVEDRDAFLKWIDETGEKEALDVRANKTFVKEFSQNTGGDIPPGVKFTQIHTVGVRRA